MSINWLLKARCANGSTVSPVDKKEVLVLIRDITERKSLSLKNRQDQSDHPLSKALLKLLK